MSRREAKGPLNPLLKKRRTANLASLLGTEVVLNCCKTNVKVPWFGLLGFNASPTARVISRFGLLGFNASPTTRVISRFGLVYWGLTPHQQPGSYQGLVGFIGV